jgi:hypothetical protein
MSSSFDHHSLLGEELSQKTYFPRKKDIPICCIELTHDGLHTWGLEMVFTFFFGSSAYKSLGWWLKIYRCTELYSARERHSQYSQCALTHMHGFWVENF